MPRDPVDAAMDHIRSFPGAMESAVNEDALERAIYLVEDVLTERRRILPPEKKAALISAIYDRII